MQKQYTYLALGDSYTIGEAVLLQESFPYRLVQLLRKQGYDMAAPEIIAKTGWTTEELQHGMASYVFSQKYDFVSLLIGVNNQYRRQDIILYKEQFESLLNKSIELAGGKKDHVFVISIPDYSITPFAKTMETERISKEIEEYNKLNKAICIQYKVPYLTITESWREARDQNDLVAEDGLHPSAKEYGRWAKMLVEALEKLLKK
jgi:lysophospholipase L1-like esterase